MKQWSTICALSLLVLAPNGLLASSQKVPEGPSAPQEFIDLQDSRAAQIDRQILVIPFLRFHSDPSESIVVLNRFSRDVAYKFFAIDDLGQRWFLGEFVSEGRSSVRYELANLLNIARRLRQGALRIEYRGDPQMLQAWAILRAGNDVGEVGFQNPRLTGESEVLSFWDERPESNSSLACPLYAVHNVSDIPALVQVQSRTVGGPWRKRVLEVPAGRTSYFSPGPRICSLGAGWARFTMDPAVEDSLAISGNLERDGIPIQLRLISSDEAAGLRDLESFPFRCSSEDEMGSEVVGGSSRLVLADSRPEGELQTVTLQVACSDSGTPATVAEARAYPGDIVTIPVVIPRCEAKAPKRLCRLFVESDDGGLIGAFSQWEASGARVDVPIVRTDVGHSAGQYPLFPIGDAEVKTTFLNLSSDPVTVLGYIAYPGKGFALAPIELSPEGAYVLDFNELASQGGEDLAGRKLPMSAGMGFFQWTAQGAPQAVLARTTVTTPGTLDSFGFNCSGCCEEVPSGGTVPSSVAFDVGQTTPFETVQWIATCSGTIGPYHVNPTSMTYASPLSWDSFYVTSTGLTNQILSFQDGDDYMWFNCQLRHWNFSGDGRATVDRCLAENNPGHDPAHSCFQQQPSCGDCYSCCERQKQVGYCQCRSSEPCRQLARAQCGSCKQSCFGHFNVACSTQEAMCEP